MPNSSQAQVAQISEVLSVSLSEIHRGLGRVEGKLDQVMGGQISHEAEDTNRFEQVNSRLAQVEKKLYIWGGAIAVIVFAISHFPFSMIFKG
jgi:tetrahydromethanopterin S-methyltransferase subunit G